MRDPMALKRDPRATALAIVINGLIVLAIVWFGTRQVGAVVLASPAKVVTLIAPPPPVLPKAPPKAVVMSGGGGHPTPRPVARGNPPKLEQKPPMLLTEAPKLKLQTTLPVQPTINVQADLRMAKADLPNLGMPSAPAVAVSAGTGAGAGLGSGIGSGLGSGSGGNYGGGVFKIGGGVAAPQVIYAPEPEFTEQARQAKVTGKVVVYLQVNPEGRPMHVRIVRGLGMGLDQKALEAVRQYKFKPATKDGHPVTVEMNIEVNFHIYS
jgi:protein TonB